MAHGTDERVDDLRRQLRALGYLDAGVDRFLLAPAARSRSPLALALRSSVRVGLLGGLLLGPAAAIGVGARMPGLINGIGDAAVIATYLAILFFVAIAIVSFVISAATPALAGMSATRARIVTSTLGWMLTIGCLSYLTFWWRNANAGFGWSAPVWTSFALVVAVGISLLLGRAIRITMLAVFMAARPAVDLRLPPRSWRVLVAGGAIALAGAAVVLVVSASAETPAVQPNLTVSGGGWRVRLIAIDGVDAKLLKAAGWIPADRVFGAAYLLAPQDTTDPARAWTTIATGEPPAVHGVRGLETRHVAGMRGALSAQGSAVARSLAAATDLVRLTRPAIVSSDQRRSMTLWEIAETAGLRSAVVNWWATWPAPPRAGIVVSDRAVLRLERGGDLDREIAPASLYPALRAAWPSIRARAAAAAREAFADATSESAATLRRSAELDATMIGLANAPPPPPRELDVVYLPGLDNAQHALLGGTGGEGPASPSTTAERLAAIRGYYGFLGHALGPWLQADEHRVTLIVTQPGRVDTPADGTLTLFQREPMDAFGDVHPHLRENGAARAVDVVPTVLAMLGVPLSRELPGKPLSGVTALLQPPSGRRYVDAYGAPFATASGQAGKPLDEEMIERLRSLGYIK